MQSNKFYDTHIHTEYAYCSEEGLCINDFDQAIKSTGIKGILCAEHAAQLYVAEGDYWSGRYMEYPELLRNPATNRMADYKAAINQVRSPQIKIGLELDLDKDGNLTLLEEDQDGWDLLIGSVHRIPARFDTLEEGFMWSLECFTKHPIDILAHPFRIFTSRGLASPKALYKPVIALLKAHDIAAEINFHHHTPDPEFFRLCIEEGVKLTFGSDSHHPSTIGQLDRHIALLQTITDLDNLDHIMYAID